MQYSSNPGSANSSPKPDRLVIYNKDIRRLMGISRRSACRVIAAIRKRNNKENSDVISLEEFCDHFKLNPAEVIRLLF